MRKHRRKIHTAIWDRCVKHTRYTAKNPFAACTAKLGKRSFLKK